MRVQMGDGDGDSPLISVGDACRGLSVDVRRVSEARLEISMDRRGVDEGVGVV